MNHRIRIARGTISSSTNKASLGQPVYDTNTKYLYIGQGDGDSDKALNEYTEDDAVKAYKSVMFDSNKYIKTCSGGDLPSLTESNYYSEIVYTNFGNLSQTSPFIIKLPTTLMATINGGATKLVNLDTSTGGVTNIKQGSSTLPVYFNDNGVPSVITGFNLNNSTSTFKVSTDASGQFIKLNGSDSLIQVNGCIQANYFNAVSDIRLKENIIDTNISALDIIDKLNIKQFNFKDKPNDTQIGIIAQELDALDTNKFFIDNSDEYLKVKENKLIYLLLKAVQELKSKIGDGD